LLGCRYRSSLGTDGLGPRGCDIGYRTSSGHQTQSLLGSRYRLSLGTDGLRLGEAATLATRWGHQTQSLPGSRYRLSLCLAPGIDPPMGHVDRSQARRGCNTGYSLGTSDSIFACLQI
jgi:hypothetical protein